MKVFVYGTCCCARRTATTESLAEIRISARSDSVPSHVTMALAHCTIGRTPSTMCTHLLYLHGFHIGPFSLILRHVLIAIFLLPVLLLYLSHSGVLSWFVDSPMAYLWFKEIRLSKCFTGPLQDKCRSIIHLIFSSCPLSLKNCI